MQLKTILPPPPREDFGSDIYAVTELMETDLGYIINTPQPLEIQHVQLFTFQMLQGLAYLHANRIVHRDLVAISKRPC